MTTAAEMIRSAQNTIAKTFAATTVTIYQPGVTAFNSDLSVSVTSDSCTVECSFPRAYVAEAGAGDASLSGTTFVVLNRADTALTIEPQPGMLAEVSGDQYRVARAVYRPGQVVLYLHGGAAEGDASA